VELEAVIGLEVHVQLGTRSKLFCACSAEFGGTPNSRICPICTGQPGVLPVLNREALRLAVLAGHALHCTIRTHTKFDRKNYFYPDLPKGYQISQFDQPIAYHGDLEFQMDDGTPRRAGITRAHLEEDAGKAVHPEGATISLVDLNRAGIPLIEIVGEPDLRSPAEAGAYLTALRRTLRYARVSECDMEKGSMRCDANVSIRTSGSERLGTKVEVKNMNSIRNVEHALAFEIERQKNLLLAGECIIQETRSFRDADGTTVRMRVKEQADDYRYFPDPDLPLFELDPSWIESIRRLLPESYRERRRRYEKDLALSDYDAEVLTEDREVSDWFEKVLAEGVAPKVAANWVQGEILAHLNATAAPIGTLRIGPRDLAELLSMVDAGELSQLAAKKVLKEMLSAGGRARDCAQSLDLLQMRDSSELNAIVDQVLREDPKTVADYQGGKKSAINGLIGKVMRASRGKGDPQVIKQLLAERLGG